MFKKNILEQFIHEDKINTNDIFTLRRTQQYPTTVECHSLIIVNLKTFCSSLIQNIIYKLIVQTIVLKTSKFV